MLDLCVWTDVKWPDLDRGDRPNACCRVEANLEQIWEAPDRPTEVCVCGRRHRTLLVEPAEFAQMTGQASLSRG